MSQRFSYVTPWVLELPHSLLVSVVTLVGVECLYMIKPIVVGFSSIGG